MAEELKKSRGAKILIADDNPQILELLEAYVESLEVAVVTALDGQATLDAVASEHPDLILLDVMMPKRSGFEVCRTLKSDPKTRAIRIIVVTALNEIGDLERAKDAGADAFLSKPVNRRDLLDCVAKLLESPPASADADQSG